MRLIFLAGLCIIGAEMKIKEANDLQDWTKYIYES